MPDSDSAQLNPTPMTESLVRPGLLLSQFLDLIFPPRCAGCGRVGVRWCARCAAELARLPVERQGKRIDIDIAATGQHRGKLRRAIHALKYDRERSLATALGARLAERLALQDWTIDIVIPVPLHATREAKRGYNQANLLAQQLANRQGVLWASDALQRRRATRSQVGLDSSQRRTNMEAAFMGDPAQLAGKTVLIVDDVCTTGATLAACAAAARAAGARTVYGLTVTVA